MHRIVLFTARKLALATSSSMPRHGAVARLSGRGFRVIPFLEDTQRRHSMPLGACRARAKARASAFDGLPPQCFGGRSTPGGSRTLVSPPGGFRFGVSASLPWKAPAPSSRLWGAGGSCLVGGRLNIPPRSACWLNLPSSALLGFSFPKFPARLSSDVVRGMRCSTWRCDINTQLHI